MKNLKRLTGLALVLAMVFALAGTAFAASGTNGNNGKITIDNAMHGETYTIYQLLTLESYDTVKNAYAYKATAAWNSFINRAEIKGTYVEVDAQGYVTWKTDADVAAFAAAAQEYAEGNSVGNQGSETATGATVEFTNLNLGYYLLDSTMGTVCSLDTTNPEVIIREKNTLPALKMEVKEDSTDAFGPGNTAQIGDTVEFKITIAADAGAMDYVLHGVLPDGFTLNEPIKVSDEITTLETNCTVRSTGLTDGCDFEIEFFQDYLDSLGANDKIIVTYSAVLNKDAKVSTDTNISEAKLTYDALGTSQKEAQTTTTTYKFDIVKTDSEKKLLTGAKFKLYTNETGGTEIPVVKDSDGLYRVAVAGETGVEIEAAVGRATVQGLDANTTYWLEETAAPVGYNKLASRAEVKIEGGNLTTVMTGDTWADGDGGVQITNKTGSELPTTGGMGTTIFYIVGAVLVLGAVVLLVAKKRMNNSER